MRPLILVFAGVLAVAAAQYDERGFYTNRYEYVDVDAILNSKRLVKYYTDCLLNIKPCSPEGKALRRILPEALRTKCGRCTERQKVSALKIIKSLRLNYKQEWEKLVARWDPSGDLTRRLENYLEKERFNELPDDRERPQYSSPAPTRVPFTSRPAPAVNPVMLNRFGGAEEDSAASNSNFGGSPPVRIPSYVPPSTPRTTTSTTTVVVPVRPTSAAPSLRPLPEESQDNIISGDTSVGSDEINTITRSPRPSIQVNPSNRVPDYIPPPRPNQVPNYVPPPSRPNPVYKGTVQLIDHFGNKIMRTTALVTDLLKNTLRLLWRCLENRIC